LAERGVAGAELTMVSFVILQSYTSVTIKVWTGGTSLADAGTEVYSQVVNSSAITIGDWTDVELTTPVTIPTSGELRVGIIPSNVDSIYGIGPDSGNSGVYLDEYSNLLYSTQSGWRTTLTFATNPFAENICINAMASGATGPVMFGYNQPTVKKQKSDKGSKVSKEKGNRSFMGLGTPSERVLTGSDIARMNKKPRSFAPAIVESYKISRVPAEDLTAEEDLGVTTDDVLTYTDLTWADVTHGASYKYVVYAIFDTSDPSHPGYSNTVTKGASEVVEALPLVTTLKGNYPNPFNPTTTIAFDKAEAGNVKIDIYNVKGQKVKSLTNEHFEAGKHRVMWNGTDNNGNNVGSGIYFYKMTSGEYSLTKKMIMMK
jgi:hypothetical protein